MQRLISQTKVFLLASLEVRSGVPLFLRLHQWVVEERLDPVRPSPCGANAGKFTFYRLSFIVRCEGYVERGILDYVVAENWLIMFVCIEMPKYKVDWFMYYMQCSERIGRIQDVTLNVFSTKGVHQIKREQIALILALVFVDSVS
jgi:hypothetical protein